MEKENENFINSQLNDTKYYNDYKILEEIGYDKLMIKKVYAYLKPKTIEDSIKYMSTINDIYQHEFFPDEININKCYFCGKKIKYHFNYENKDKIKEKIKFEGKLLEGNLNYKINDEKYKILKEKGKKATCRIISKDKKGNGINGSGFFCKILYLNKIIKVLFTNNHILNKEAIEKGKKIKLVYKGLIKEIEITGKRFCKTSLQNDFLCKKLEEDKIEFFLKLKIIIIIIMIMKIFQLYIIQMEVI